VAFHNITFPSIHILQNEIPKTEDCKETDRSPSEGNKQYLCFYQNNCSDVLYYYHSDHTVSRFSVIGSSTFLTDAIGLPYEFMLYLPFGEAMAQQKVAGWATPYTFTGKEVDGLTGLHYFGARYLDSRLSVWFGVDPLAEKMPDWSSYAYAFNNPVRFIDPDGRIPIIPFIILGLLLLEAQPASTPGSDNDNRTIRQAQQEHNENQLVSLLPGGRQVKASKIVAARVVNEVRSEVKEEVVKRVSPRKSTKEQVTQNQPRDSEGRMIDPNTKEPLKTGEIDLGHKAGNEWKTRAQMHKEKGSTRKEVIEAENNPNLYHWEDRTSNRSHKHELKSGNYNTSE